MACATFHDLDVMNRFPLIAIVVLLITGLLLVGSIWSERGKQSA